MTTRRALWAVIGVSLVLRLICAASLGVYTNEALWYMYAQHLDWGYFDHPPMVGLVSALGLKLVGGVSPIFGLRLGFVIMFAGSSWLLARLTARWFGAKAGVLAVVVLNVTIYYGLMIGTFSEPDGPLLFFWLLVLDRLWVALEAPGQSSTSSSTWAWVGVGLAWGGALLSKYHAVLLPAGAVLYLLLRPARLRCLRQPGPYLAAFLGLLVFSPVIFWNAGHRWVSFLYQGTRAGGFHGLQLARLQEALVGQILYLTPWIWAALVVVLVRQLRRGPRRWSDAEAFLLCQSVPALGLFLGVSTFQRIMPHWPLIGFVALMPLLGRALAERLATHPVRVGRWLAVAAAAPVLLALLFIVHARTGLFQDSHGRLLGVIAPVSDPSVDTIRWDQIAHALKQRGLLDEPGTFLFTENWRFSAELAMAAHCPARVTCYHPDSRSFTFWSRPQDWLGRDGIFVRVQESQAPPLCYADCFTRVEPLGTIPIVRAGTTLQTASLYRYVRQTEPFAFGRYGPDAITETLRQRRKPGDQPVLGRGSEPPTLH